MSYTPTIWENGKKPALNATNLNKIENELAKLDNIVSMPDITEITETTMPNSYDGRLKIDSIGGGESQQNSTSGKNLLDCSGLTETTSNGVTFTPKYADNGELEYINVNGTATAQTNYAVNSGMTFGNTSEYIFSTQAQGSDSTIFAFVSTDGHLVQCNDAEKNFTPLSASTVYTCYIRVRANQTVTNLKFYPMIRLASVADGTYEPFTNGVSPNPSYPQEIKKTVVSEIRTHGKNFFDGVDQHYYLNGGCTQGGANSGDTGFALEVSGGTYTVSTKVAQTRFRVACANELGTTFNCFNGVNKDNRDTVTSITIDCTGHSYLIVNATDLSAIQVEKGEVATEYEPYTESVITLSQPIELYGMGDVQDVIEGGKVKRKFAKRIFDGTENWKASGTLVGRYYFENVDSKNYGFVLCSHAKGIRGSSTEINVCYVNTANNPRGRFLINTEFATVDEWKAHLASNPMTVVYELAEETTEELPLADQIALNSLSTYDGITYLEFDSEIEPTFKGEYGTSKVGGYTLEGMLAGRNGELYGKDYNSRLSALETSVVNNI